MIFWWISEYILFSWISSDKTVVAKFESFDAFDEEREDEATKDGCKITRLRSWARFSSDSSKDALAVSRDSQGETGLWSLSHSDVEMK